jgi:hypothetical protein
MAERKYQEKKTPPSNETKEARFVRVATPRVVRVIKYIELLGNCASSAYGYTPEQVKKMTDAIEDALVGTVEKFAGKMKVGGEFSF